MQHEVLTIGAGQGVHDLLVVARAQGGHHQGLGLTTGEQRRAMGPWQHADLTFDLPHGAGIAAINALAGIKYLSAHDVFFQLLDGAADGARQIAAWAATLDW